jgi:hypothetical protein
LLSTPRKNHAAVVGIGNFGMGPGVVFERDSAASYLAERRIGSLM